MSLRAMVTAALLLLPLAGRAHVLDTPTARVSLRDGHVEVLAELDLLLLLGADPTAVATAPEPELAAQLRRARQAVEAQTWLEADGARVALALRQFPSPPELRAAAATLSAAGRDHGELVPVRFEASRGVHGAASLSLALPPALGPTLVTFAQLSTRYAAPGRPATFPVLGAAPPPEGRAAPAPLVLGALLSLLALALTALLRPWLAARRAVVRA